MLRATAAVEDVLGYELKPVISLLGPRIGAQLRDIALARRQCGELGMQIGSEGVQLLGGHGFVKEHPVERWYRDLRAAGLMEGALLV